ncbi:MAG TPA: hypothetical protein VHM20_08840, partial [Gammaproteobacteria bacterium]|nr:hypothetical protein [Gammaproteobacteria bacterium]
MVISYLEKFLQKIINLVNIAKSTNDNQKLAPAIEGLINLASPSENRTIRFNTSISAIGIIGGIVGFTLGFIIGVPLGLMLGAIFGGIPMIVLGSSIPMLAIGYFAGCGLLGGLALGISGAEKFYESCTGNSVTTFTYNPLSEFEQQKTKTFNTNIFCRLFKDRKIEPESKERHNENRDDETMTKQAIGIR